MGKNEYIELVPYLIELRPVFPLIYFVYPEYFNNQWRTKMSNEISAFSKSFYWTFIVNLRDNEYPIVIALLLALFVLEYLGALLVGNALYVFLLLYFPLSVFVYFIPRQF